MPATRDGKTWCSQFYYEDWQGVRHKKNKRGFKTKAEAEEWERNFRQQQRKDLDINFENFVETLLLAIVGLRYGGVQFVRPHRAHTLVFEIDMCRCRRSC